MDTHTQDIHTHIHTHRTTTVTLAAHARRGLTSTVTLAHARRGFDEFWLCVLYIYKLRSLPYLGKLELC